MFTPVQSETRCADRMNLSIITSDIYIIVYFVEETQTIKLSDGFVIRRGVGWSRAAVDLKESRVIELLLM